VATDLRDRVVAVAVELPSNAAYLAHLAKSADPGLIRLASNENTEPPSPRVGEALRAAYDDANLSPLPVPRLRTVLAERHGVGTDQVLVTAGSTEVIDATLRTFVAPGDRVVMPMPGWPVCRRRLQALQADVAEVPLLAGETAWTFDVEAILAAVTPDTKLIVLCTPNNPTGNAMALDDVERVAALRVPVLLDAAYLEFDAGVDLMSVARAHPHVIITRTFSKAYCLAGLRVGYAVGSPELIDYVDRFLVPGSSISTAALHAGLAALGDEEHLRRQVARITAERERLTAGLRGLGYRAWESRGNFVSVDASEYPGSSDGLAEAILAGGVVVRPFGDLVRVSVGTAAENDVLLEAAAAAVVA
jgi:histidinol-phosphate aminotransferase